MRDSSIYGASPAKTFQDLLVWRKAHQFVLTVYKLTQEFPKQETYGLVSQMRRAAVSIPANIAEGFSQAQPSGQGSLHEYSGGIAGRKPLLPHPYARLGLRKDR